MLGLPKILVIEDDLDCSGVYQDAMEGQAVVLIADDTDTANRLFAENPDLDGILMDGEVPGSFTTVDLVIRFKQTFDGPFAAATGGRKQEALLRAGCNLNMPKPITMDKLMSFVRAAAAYRQQRPS